MKTAKLLPPPCVNNRYRAASQQLAHRHADGLPLYRIEKELSQVGVDIQRATLARWMIKTAELLSLVYRPMHEALLKESVIHGDETTLQVLKEPDKKRKVSPIYGRTLAPSKALTLSSYSNISLANAGKDHASWLLGPLTAQVQRCIRPKP
ncbi:IS66 family transposase [Photobacterium nomapromontoriensis]|uniref:IS66 family transposase n=1 Tax=Photobacterium nomapromontoriensis TaxID=2910237 RepID=UPI003D0E2681